MNASLENSTLNKLHVIVDEKQREEAIKTYEALLVEKYSETFNFSSNFFSLPLKTIFSIISKIPLEELIDPIDKVSNFIRKTLEAHPGDKECLFFFLLPNLMDICNSIEDFLRIFSNFDNISFFKKLSDLYYESLTLVEFDTQSEFELLEQKQSAKQESSTKIQNIHDICKQGNLSDLKHLIEDLHVDKESTLGTELYTPLHIACRYNKLKIVKYLCEEQHANIEALTLKQSTPLAIACKYGNLEIIKYLIEKQNANIHIKSKLKRSLIHVAASGKVESFAYLIQRYHQTPNVQDVNGWTPLHIACKTNKIGIVQFLIEKCKADKMSLTNSKMTPLHIASKFGHGEIVKYLLSINVDKNAKDKNGNTPADIAKTPEIRKLLFTSSDQVSH